MREISTRALALLTALLAAEHPPDAEVLSLDRSEERTVAAVGE